MRELPQIINAKHLKSAGIWPRPARFGGASHNSSGRKNYKMKSGSKLLTSCVALVSVLAALPVLTFAQASKETNHYVQTNLVTDPNSGFSATFTDKQLKNPWGLARSTTSPWWISDNNAGVSTLYDGTGAKKSLVVAIPGPNGSDPKTFVAPPTG